MDIFFEEKPKNILGNLLLTKVSNRLLLVLRETLSETRAFCFSSALFCAAHVRYHKHVFEVVRFAGDQFFFGFRVILGTLFVDYFFFQTFDAWILIILAPNLYTNINRLHWNDIE